MAKRLSFTWKWGAVAPLLLLWAVAAQAKDGSMESSNVPVYVPGHSILRFHWANAEPVILTGGGIPAHAMHGLAPGAPKGAKPVVEVRKGQMGHPSVAKPAPKAKGHVAKPAVRGKGPAVKPKPVVGKPKTEAAKGKGPAVKPLTTVAKPKPEAIKAKGAKPGSLPAKGKEKTVKSGQTTQE